MISYLPKTLAALLVLSILGCEPSDDPEDILIDDPVAASTLRLEQVIIQSVDITAQTIDIVYTETGNILRETFRSNGQVNRINTFETTAGGQLVRRSNDTNADGIEDFETRFVYNSSGNLSRVEHLDSNGSINEIEIYAFQNGLAISREHRDIEDTATSGMVDIFSGTLLSFRAFQYEDRQLVAINIDSTGNGVFDQREDYSYNPNGTLETTSLNSVIDGVTGTNSYIYGQGACSLWGDTSATYFCVIPE